MPTLPEAPLAELFRAALLAVEKFQAVLLVLVWVTEVDA